MMQVYKVGGAVRDRIMRNQGLDAPTSDVDWVVVGASPETMLKNGFIPVGNDFPVFLHPITHEEYALARTERKTARGYHGFTFYTAPDVTIEADLYRRDLTINAMAEAEDGSVIDPYGGQRDIAQKTLRHVSPAFCEDPVRILRIARFNARFPDFSIAPETEKLLCEMVDSGEADTLVAERIWAEISKGLKEKRPSKMLDVLSWCGYWNRAWPTIPLTDRTKTTIDKAAQLNDPFEVRAAILFSSVTNNAVLKTVLKALRVQLDISELAMLFQKNHQALLLAQTVEAHFQVLDSSDLLRRPTRFRQFVRLLELIDEYNPRRILALAEMYVNVDVKSIAVKYKGKDIRKAISEARLKALREREHLCQH